MDTQTRDQRLSQIAELQHGAFSRKQAYAAGFDNRSVKLRLAQGQWQPVHPNVYRPGASPPTFVTTANAALLHCGDDAAFSHLTAARLYDLDVRVATRDVFVTVPQEQKPSARSGIVVTRSRTMEGHTVVVHGSPVMSLPRTIVDLSHILDEDAMSHVLYDVIRGGRLTIEQIAAANERVERRAGCSMLRGVLMTFDAAYDSHLESLAASALAQAGIAMVPQYAVHDAGRLIARFDFADPGAKVAVEIDGRSHGGPGAVAKDKRRDRRVAVQDWLTLRFTAEDVLHRRDAMIREVGTAIAVRRTVRERHP